MTLSSAFRRPIIRFAGLLATVGGFAAVMASMAAFGLAGLPSGFGEHWTLAFTLYLSVLAIVQSSAILVGQRESERAAHHRDEALHAKVDGLIRGVDQADDRLIGIEREVEGDPT